jgi:hypothetical protein
VRVSALFFFYRLPTRPTWNNNALSAQPQKKKLFSKKFFFRAVPPQNFNFPKKVGRSVGRSVIPIFTLLGYFIRNTYMVPVLHIHTCIIRAIHSAQQKILPSGSSTTIFFFSFPIFTHLGILSTFVYFFPYTFHKKYGVEGKAQGGERGLYRNNKGPHKTEPRARVRIM